MDRAIEETERRRKKQLKYNQDHGITPESIVKAISDVRASIYEADYVLPPSVKEPLSPYESLDDIRSKIRVLTREMRDAAAGLEFEKAAELRDQVKKLQERELELLSPA